MAKASGEPLMVYFFSCVLPYIAAATFVGGMLWRTGRWLRRPVLYPMALGDESGGRTARAAAVALELATFRSLLRGDPLLWAAAWLMHAALALVVVGHIAGIASLGRQFTLLGVDAGTSQRLSAASGTVLGWLLAVTLVVLLVRRTAVPEVKRLSSPADYFDLMLLMAVVATGLAMRMSAEVDLAAVRGYMASLYSFEAAAMPGPGLFLVHFSLFNVLLIYWPFSKLVHLTGAVVNRALFGTPAPIYPTPGRLTVPVAQRART